MKHNKRRSLPTIIIILMLTTACYSGHVSAQAPVTGTVSYQSFYDNLSPYGTWINYPGYGHVWNPRLKGEFRPYATNGNWVYSDEGWAWSSNYAWDGRLFTTEVGCMMICMDGCGCPVTIGLRHG